MFCGWLRVVFDICSKCLYCCVFFFVFFKAEDGIGVLVRSRGLGDVYKRQSGSSPVIGDDVTSGVMALPFPFLFFGSSVTHFSANSNGLMQVHASDMGVPSDTFDNSVIPLDTDPNGLIAPFWDDLRACPL